MSRLREWASGQNKVVLVVAALLTAVIMVVAVDKANSGNQADAEEAPKEEKEEVNEHEDNPVYIKLKEEAKDYGASLDDLEAVSENGSYTIIVTYNLLTKKDTRKLKLDLERYSSNTAFSLGEWEEVDKVIMFWDFINLDPDVQRGMKSVYERDGNEMMLVDNQFSDYVFGE